MTIQMTKPSSVRLSKDAENSIAYLMKEYPEDYPTRSLVIRAGVIHLQEWKKAYDEEKSK